MNYKATGDKELWMVTSESMVTPIYCTPVEDISGNAYWIILSAVHLHRGQHATLALSLQPLSVINELDRWVIQFDRLKEVATKCLGVTPQYYFRAPDESPTHAEFDADENPTPPNFDEDFIRQVWHRSQVAKMGVFKVVWAALIQGIAHRLIVEHKPLDLGWFSIHALPYRENWKHNLLFKHPKLHAYYGGMTASIRQAMMKRDGIYADLLRTDMMAIKFQGGRPTIRWSLEIEQSPQWLKYVDQVEHDRLTGATTTAYIHRWGTIVKRSIRVINVLLTQFVQQLSLPAARPVEISGGIGKRLVSYTPAGSGRKIMVDRVDRDLVLDVEDFAIRPPNGEESEGKTPRKMPELPVIRLDPFHMRASGGGVAGRGGKTTDSGLPLPAEGGGDGPPQDMLD